MKICSVFEEYDLLHVDLNITNGCNFHCAHCHSSSGTVDDGELSTDQVINIIHQVYELGAVSLAIAGGEPFLRKDIGEILAAASALGSMHTVVVTNGSLLSRERLSRLREIAPEVGISISLDGSTPQTFGRIRGRVGASLHSSEALFERVLISIKETLLAGFEMSVNFTMTNESLEDLDDTYQLVVKELGVSTLLAIKFFPGGYGRNELDRFDVPWSRWQPYLASLTDRKINGELPGLQISLPSAWEFYLPLIAMGTDLDQAERIWSNRSPLRYSSFGSSIGDSSGITNLAIGSNGIVYPSVLVVGDNNCICGDLTLQSLNDIWRSSSLFKDIRALKAVDIEAECFSCPIVSMCGGGSRMRAYTDSGSMRGADASCPMIQHSQT